QLLGGHGWSSLLLVGWLPGCGPTSPLRAATHDRTRAVRRELLRPGGYVKSAMRTNEERRRCRGGRLYHRRVDPSWITPVRLARRDGVQGEAPRRPCAAGEE